MSQVFFQSCLRCLSQASLSSRISDPSWATKFGDWSTWPWYYTNTITRLLNHKLPERHDIGLLGDVCICKVVVGFSPRGTFSHKILHQTTASFPVRLIKWWCCTSLLNMGRELSFSPERRPCAANNRQKTMSFGKILAFSRWKDWLTSDYNVFLANRLIILHFISLLLYFTPTVFFFKLEITAKLELPNFLRKRSICSCIATMLCHFRIVATRSHHS